MSFNTELLGLRAVKRASIMGIARGVADISGSITILTTATSLAIIVEKIRSEISKSGIIPGDLLRELVITMGSVVIVFGILIGIEILISLLWWYEIVKGYDMLSTSIKRSGVIFTKIMIKYLVPVSIMITIVGVTFLISSFVYMLPKLSSGQAISIQELAKTVQESLPAVLGASLMFLAFIIFTISAIAVGIGFISLGDYYRAIYIKVAGILLILSTVIGLGLAIPVIGIILSVTSSVVSVTSYILIFIGLRTLESKISTQYMELK